MAQLGRISGPLLEENLLRQNVNLDFRNENASTPVLKLDVVNSKLGVNTLSPSQAVSVNGTARATNLRSTNLVQVGNLQVTPLGISSLSGPITFTGTAGVVATGIGTDQLILQTNRIYSYLSNADVEIQPNGTGTIELLTDTNVTGNLHATGNITANGNIVIGNDDTDSLTLAGELTSDIEPDDTATYNLGSTTKRWQNLWSDDVTATDITASAAIVNSVNITTTQGNIVYVAKNGSDSNDGVHQLDPVLTLAHAITLASSGDTIHISPGTYVETFPLTVPVNVTITGQDMRNVIITPSGATDSNDAFLVNGEVTIENLTIKDFYYNSGSDTGYGFRYSANSVVTSRSPYIRNCTVITKGSITNSSDPRGFNQGDAGRGALVDGASVTTVSKEASMLFHAATFITPGQQSLTAKNGVRIEWLNSFAYFASIGIKTEQGSTGQAGQGAKFGAEIRCIGSANVYGTKGIVADGAASIIYLINHNFGYIGAGSNTSNDKTLHIQTNETIELNDSTIVYTSLDQSGTYRVGSALSVNQQTGRTVIDSTNFDFSGVEKLSVTTGGQTVQLKGEKVETDFIRFSGSTMESIVGTLTIDANAGDIALTSNTEIQGNLDVTGNVTLGGTLVRLGNADTDTIDFNADIDGNLIPNLNTFNFGNSAKRWNELKVNNAYLDNVNILGNAISTSDSNSVLELESSGNGNVSVTSPIRFYNTFTQTTGSTNTIAGAIGITGNLSVANDITSNNATLLTTSASTLTAQGAVVFDNITFIGDTIQGTSGNNDLQFIPAGTGNVKILSDLVLGRDLIAPVASFSLANVLGLDRLIAEEYIGAVALTGDAVIEDVAIADNIISTRSSNSDLVLRAAGTGIIRFKSNVELAADVITPTTSSVATTSTNNLGAKNLIVQTLNSVNKQIIFEDIMFSGNKVSTTNSDSDLTFSATGTGNVKIKENFVVSNNLTTLQATSLQSTTVTNTFTANNITATGITGVGSSIFEGISLSGNVISAKDSNANLELRANGTGNVTLGEDVIIENGITVAGTITIGSITVQDNYEAVNLTTDNLNTTGTPTLKANFDKVRISGNTFNTIVTDTDLELRASGTGTISMNEDVVITNDITVGGKLYANNINIQNDVDLGALEVLGNIQIDDNFIETTISNSNLELRANGSGIVNYNGLLVSTNILTNNSGNLQLNPTDVLTINTTGSMIMPKGTTAQRSSSPTTGTVRYNTSINQFVGYGPATNNVLSSALLSDDYRTGIELSNIGISNDINFKINNNIIAKFTSNNKTEFEKVELSGITLDSNNITVTNANTDLTLDARHARVTFSDAQFEDNLIIADGSVVSFANSGTGFTRFVDDKAIVIPSGNSASREASPETGHTRYNTELSYLEVFTGSTWATAVGSGGAASQSDMEDLLNTYTIIFG